MLRIIGFGQQTIQTPCHAAHLARPIRMGRLAVQCCILVLLTSSFSSKSHAASDLNIKIISRNRAILVGQQQAGLPLKLHGVFEGFDPSTHTVKLTHLAPMETFWEKAVCELQLDDSVSTNAVVTGTAVTATLTRRPNGRYYITGLASNR